MASSVSSNWKKLSGKDNWDGLMDLLSPEFNYDTKSKAYGFSLHPPEGFFSNVNLQNGNPYQYTVTKFFYATSDFKLGDWLLSGGSAWMGYVAVSTEADPPGWATWRSPPRRGRTSSGVRGAGPSRVWSDSRM